MQTHTRNYSKQQGKRQRRRLRANVDRAAQKVYVQWCDQDVRANRVQQWERTVRNLLDSELRANGDPLVLARNLVHAMWRFHPDAFSDVLAAVRIAGYRAWLDAPPSVRTAGPGRQSKVCGAIRKHRS